VVRMEVATHMLTALKRAIIFSTFIDLCLSLGLLHA